MTMSSLGARLVYAIAIVSFNSDERVQWPTKHRIRLASVKVCPSRLKKGTIKWAVAQYQFCRVSISFPLV